jgi:hypothetical protein
MEFDKETILEEIRKRGGVDQKAAEEFLTRSTMSSMATFSRGSASTIPASWRTRSKDGSACGQRASVADDLTDSRSESHASSPADRQPLRGRGVGPT